MKAFMAFWETIESNGFLNLKEKFIAFNTQSKQAQKCINCKENN